MSDMKVNAELFLKIADRIEAAPENYDQCLWGVTGECGCIFYHAGVIAFNDKDACPIEIYKFMGLSVDDAQILISGRWKPRKGLTVPEALREIANGKSVSEVSA